MRSYIGRCDSCGKNLYHGDVCYDVTVGIADLTLCERCCKKHDMSAGLNDFSTADLVEELQSRDGVSSIWAAPHKHEHFMVDGPAWVLTVVD